MISGIGKEAYIFLYAVVSGAVLLSAYHLLRCVRRLVPHSMAAVGLEDLLFWIGSSGWMFHRIYAVTQGRIRWFFIAGMLAGAALSGIILSLFGKICTKIKKKLEKSGKNR